MNNQSELLQDAFAPRNNSSSYKAIVLVVMCFCWSLKIAEAQSAITQLPKNVTQKQKPSYVCPMHPEVKSKKKRQMPEMWHGLEARDRCYWPSLTFPFRSWFGRA